MNCMLLLCSGAVWAVEAVHQSDSSAAGWAVRPGQTPRVCVLRGRIWPGELSVSEDWKIIKSCISWITFVTKAQSVIRLFVHTHLFLCTTWITFVFKGCWWWLRCLLHHCWWGPHQLPHLQQTLKPRNCKFDILSQNLDYLISNILQSH